MCPKCDLVLKDICCHICLSHRRPGTSYRQKTCDHKIWDVGLCVQYKYMCPQYLFSHLLVSPKAWHFLSALLRLHSSSASSNFDLVSCLFDLRSSFMLAVIVPLNSNICCPICLSHPALLICRRLHSSSASSNFDLHSFLFVTVAY